MSLVFFENQLQTREMVAEVPTALATTTTYILIIYFGDNLIHLCCCLLKE